MGLAARSAPASLASLAGLQLLDSQEGGSGAEHLISIGDVGKGIPTAVAFWGGSARTYLATKGMWGQQLAAPGTGVASAIQATYAPFPFGRDWSTVSAELRRGRLFRYAFECMVERAAVTPNSELFLGVQTGTRPFTALADSGVQLKSYSEQDGGAWVARIKPVADGSAAAETLTGIGPTTARAVRFEFVDGLTPTLTVTVDGVTVLSRSGLANLPAHSSSNFLPTFGWYGNSLGSGQLARVYAARYTMELIG